LPPHVYFRNMKIEVSTFVAAVRQCYKCGKFVHISKFCMKEKQYFSCGEVKHEGSCVKKCLNCNGNHRANSERCPVIKKQKEINQIMAHRNVEFLEARTIVEKWSQPWQSNPAFSLGADSPRGYAEPNMRNFPLLKTPRRRRECDNIETSESNKSLNQPSVWNPGRGQWKMTTDNSRTQISETSCLSKS
jgi:hypothetical protein